MHEVEQGKHPAVGIPGALQSHAGRSFTVHDGVEGWFDGTESAVLTLWVAFRQTRGIFELSYLSFQATHPTTRPSPR
jgi:hypothetical protein